MGAILVRGTAAVQACDVVFTKGAGILGTLIRYAETSKGEAPAWANHVGVVFQSEKLVPVEGLLHRPDAVVVEALERTVKGSWYEKHKSDDAYQAIVYRRRDLSPERKVRVLGRAESFVGSRYGWWKLLVNLADRVVFGGRVVFRKVLFVDSRPICSYVVARAFAPAGISFGVPPEAADPDTMLDYCISHPEEWEFVGHVMVQKNGTGALAS